jgi:hypothetical protein
MKEYSFGRLCLKCGFTRVYEVKGIKLDNQDFDSHTKYVLKEIEETLKEANLKECNKFQIEESNSFKIMEEARKYFFQEMEKYLKYYELEKEIHKKRISKKDKIKELRELKKSLFPEPLLYIKLSYCLKQLLECIGIEVAMRFERYHRRKPENKSFLGLNYDILSDGNFIEVKTSMGKEIKLLTSIKGKKGFLTALDFLSSEILCKGRRDEKLIEEWINELKRRFIYYVRIDKRIFKYIEYSPMIYSHMITLYIIPSYEVLVLNDQFVVLLKELKNIISSSSEIFLSIKTYSLSEELKNLYILCFQEYLKKLQPLKIIPSEQIIILLKTLEQLIERMKRLYENRTIMLK